MKDHHFFRIGGCLARLSPLLWVWGPAALRGADTAHEPMVAGIMDNSFLVEEAYNQESGIVQHILNGYYRVDKLGDTDARGWDLAFTQEWPLFSQKHQVSYTLPYTFDKPGGDTWHDGVGDIVLNYRFQAYLDDQLRAFAPRFSVILPSGDADAGFGNDTVGYQLNLPFSAPLSDRWAIHANAGLTWLPNAGVNLQKDLTHFNLGASAIFAVSERFHLMTEWIGTWADTALDGNGHHHEFASVLSPGARLAFNFPRDTQLVLGAAVPVGLTATAPDIGAFLYLSFEHRFMEDSGK